MGKKRSFLFVSSKNNSSKSRESLKMHQLSVLMEQQKQKLLIVSGHVFTSWIFYLQTFLLPFILIIISFKMNKINTILFLFKNKYIILLLKL